MAYPAWEMEPLSTQILATLSETEIDAIVEVMLLAAFSDGTLAQAEASVIKRTLLAGDQVWFASVNFEDRMAQAKERIEAESRDARLATLRTMLPWPEQRFFALKLAVRVVAADGVIEPSERELIVAAAEALGVSAEIAAALVGQPS